MRNITNSYLEKKGFGASDTVTFQDLRMRACNFHETNQVLAANFDVDESQDGQAYSGRVDLSTIADNDSGLFHLVNPFRHRRGGESHDAPEVCERHTGIFLQFS